MNKLRATLFSFFFLLLISHPVLSQNKPAQPPILNGGGATFPYPLYQKMFQNYKSTTTTIVKYEAIGSGKGYKKLKAEELQFAATDMFFDSKLLSELPRAVIHIPICLGSVALAYNLPGKPDIQLNSDIISDIFQGTITQWNDPKIQAINPSILLPDLFIVPIHRSDSSGSTFIFTEYLSKTSPDWKEQIGITPTLEGCMGMAAENSLQAAKMLQQIPGSISYQELSYCLANNQSVAKIQNQKGNYIRPTLASVSQAGNTNLPMDGRISLTNTDSAEGYPIASFSWIVVYKEQNYANQTKAQAEDLVKFLVWMTHDGQKIVEESGYSPLHKKTILAIEQSLKTITYSGKSLQ